MNNKVKFLRGTSDEYAVAEKDSDTIYFTTDDGKLYIGDKEVSGDGSITIDNTLSDTSTNPVQNKVVKQAIDNKADKTVATTSADGLMSAEDKSKLDAFEITTTGGKLHDKDIATTDLIPTSLPANGGNADTVNGHAVEKDVPADAVFTDTIYNLPTAGLNTLGGVKTTSPVTSSSGYTPCPIISGVPYYQDTNTTYTLSSLGVTMSTSSASGGSNGNVHFQYS